MPPSPPHTPIKKAPPIKFRDFCAHVIQICDYIEDQKTCPTTFDTDVLYAKVAQVRKIAWDFNIG